MNEFGGCENLITEEVISLFDYIGAVWVVFGILLIGMIIMMFRRLIRYYENSYIF